jgi:hypothetical protein
MSTTEAIIDMAAQFRGSAPGDGCQRLQLLVAELSSMTVDE